MLILHAYAARRIRLMRSNHTVRLAVARAGGRGRGGARPVDREWVAFALLIAQGEGRSRRWTAPWRSPMCERVARERTRGWLPIGPREDDNQPWMLNSACLARRMLALHACLARSALALSLIHI